LSFIPFDSFKLFVLGLFHDQLHGIFENIEPEFFNVLAVLDG